MSHDQWEHRVQQLEAEGLTRSDAQAVADAEAEKPWSHTRMSQHTPGPWTVTPENWIVGCQDAIHRKQVATIPMTKDGDEQANARLIEACPTLYEYVQQRASQGDKEAQQIIERINA